MNKILAICIPTHNRAGKLGDSLKNLLPIIEKYDIGVYVSDNASQDNTREIVEAYQKVTDNIVYHRNDVNLGWIRNFEDVIRMANSQYSWLCGDDDLIVVNAVDDILRILSKNTLDLMVVNGGKKCKDGEQYLCSRKNICSQFYTDRNKLFGELGPYMSWMSGLIFSREFMHRFSLEDYDWSPFAHTVAIFDALLKQDAVNVYFKAEPCVYVNRFNSTGDDYTPKLLEYFSTEWLRIVDFFVGYSDESRRDFLYGYRDHIVDFGLTKFVFLRIEGKYDYSIYKKLKDNLQYITRVNKNILLLIAILPPILPKICAEPLKHLRARFSKWV